MKFFTRKSTRDKYILLRKKPDHVTVRVVSKMRRRIIPHGRFRSWNPSTETIIIMRLALMNKSATFLNVARTSQFLSIGSRAYSVKSKAKQFNQLLDRIGDENTKESQKTISIIRKIGAGSIVLVLCSLFWASSLSAPVKETPVDMGNLAHDLREVKK